MARSRSLGRLVLLGWGMIMFGLVAAAWAESPRPAAQAAATSAVPPPELAVLQALRANPVTAPYPITTSWRQGRVVLAGVVGTRTIHDVAIRLAIAAGYPVGDELKIDTAAAHVVAAQAAAAGSAPMSSYGLVPSYGSVPSGSTQTGMGWGSGSPYYVYPPPLFGRLDNPFFGFEPPLVSYPPWYRAVAAREPISLSPAATAGPGQAPGANSTPLLAPPGKDGAVEMTIDSRGVAVLRGVVYSLGDRVAIAQKIAQTPGVSQVINELTVVPRPVSETVPPPPQPASRVAPKAPGAPEPAPPPALQQPGPGPGAGRDVDVDRNDLNGRVEQAVANRPALAGLPIKVSVRDGVASLSGRVPTVYEAMLAYRTAQQIPGVHDVDDRLEFVVPDGVKKNPLIAKGRPEDVEPYLTAQIRRQLGDIAHVDQVHLRGDTLEIRGTVRDEDDRPRLDAILHSMAILRDFRLEPTFLHD